MGAHPPRREFCPQHFPAPENALPPANPWQFRHGPPQKKDVAKIWTYSPPSLGIVTNESVLVPDSETFFGNILPLVTIRHPRWRLVNPSNGAIKTQPNHGHVKPWCTPLKIIIEPENDGLEDDFPDFNWVIFRFQPLIFQGVTSWWRDFLGNYPRHDLEVFGGFVCSTCFFVGVFFEQRMLNFCTPRMLAWWQHNQHNLYQWIHAMKENMILKTIQYVAIALMWFRVTTVPTGTRWKDTLRCIASTCRFGYWNFGRHASYFAKSYLPIR